MRVRAAVLICALMCYILSYISIPAAAGDIFIDVKPGDWFYNDVDYVNSNKLMLGTGESTFEPEGQVTMQMLITMLWRLNGGSENYGQPENVWYGSAMYWAHVNNILDADAVYPENTLITREELAVVLYKFFGYKGVSQSDGDSLRRFSDTAKISRDALPAFKWTVSAGLINGVSAHRLEPKGNVTRAQIAAILRRCSEGPAELEKQDIQYAPEFQYSAEEVREKIADKGTLLTPGMDAALYNDAINAQWKEITFSEGVEPQYLDFTFDKVYAYEELEAILFDLAKRDEVRLYEIGETKQGRKIYNIEVGTGEKTILLSGGVHASELGGSYVLLRMLCDKVAEAETNSYAKALLNEVKYAAIVMVNPDGYEYNRLTGSRIDCNNENGDGTGVDINRNFPNSFAGQNFDEIDLSYTINYSPARMNYAGEQLGSAPETRAVMNFLHKYIVEDESAVLYIDLHQQGRVVFLSPRSSKIDDTTANVEFGAKLISYLGYSYGNYSRLGDGTGGTTARMAMEFSFGFKMSPYGVMGLDVNGEILPSIFYKDIEGYREYYPNKNAIPSITLELTYVDFSSGMLNNVYESWSEYTRFGYSGFLTYLAEELK